MCSPAVGHAELAAEGRIQDSPLLKLQQSTLPVMLTEMTVSEDPALLREPLCPLWLGFCRRL